MQLVIKIHRESLQQITRQFLDYWWGGGTENLPCLREVGEGHPKFTCSRRLEGDTQIKRSCVDQQNRIKFKKKYFRLRLGAPLGRMPAGPPTQSPMEFRHCYVTSISYIRQVDGFNIDIYINEINTSYSFYMIISHVNRRIRLVGHPGNCPLFPCVPCLSVSSPPSEIA